MLEWKEREEASDHSDILEFCCDTANGLRDRAAGWPDVEDDIEALKQFVDGASDMAVLMQIEGGPDQAIDAARLIFQLRTALERALFAPKSSETMGMSQ